MGFFKIEKKVSEMRRNKTMKIAKQSRDQVIARWEPKLPDFTISYLASAHSLKHLDKPVQLKARHNKIPNRSGNTGQEDMGVAMVFCRVDSTLCLLAEVRIGKKHLTSTYGKLTAEGNAVLKERIFICADDISAKIFTVFKFKDVPPAYITKRKGNRIDIKTSHFPRISSFQELNSILLQYIKGQKGIQNEIRQSGIIESVNRR